MSKLLRKLRIRTNLTSSRFREINLANDIARAGIQDVDKVGRVAFPGRNVQELPVRMNRQPIDTGIDGPIPEHRIVVDIKAINHPDAGAGAVGHVESAG